MKEEGEFVPPIMRIPREIRGVIFSKLSQAQAINLRYVSRQFKADVDDFCEFAVVLDERQPHLERISQLRIRKCRVLQLLEPMKFLGNDDDDQNGTKIFFKFPGLLRSLKLLSEQISPENLYILLSDTMPHLLEFCGVLTLSHLSYEGYPSTFAPSFDNLSRLKLSILTVPEGPIMGPPRLQDRLLHKILDGFPKGQGKKTKLKMLAMAIRCVGFTQCSSLSAKVLAFIALNHESLEHVDFDMIQGHGMMSFNEVKPLSENDLASIPFSYLRKVEGLKSIRIVNSTAVGIDLWTQLLAQQKYLQFLETDILPVPNQLYKQVILNNEDTLIHIDIGDLTIDSDGDDEDSRYFDCTVFQNCRFLKKLTLDRNTLLRRPFGLAHRAELINLHCLPEFLEELAINYFTILSDELLILFSSGISQNLKSLTLTQCGEIGQFGVDGTVLEKIISMRDISFIEISPLNFSDPEERAKLNAILTTFGYNQDHAYFQLSKVSQNFQINFEDFLP